MEKVVIDSIRCNVFIERDDSLEFSEEVSEIIESLQTKGYFVEVDYKPVFVNENCIVYTALIVGKEKVYAEVK